MADDLPLEIEVRGSKRSKKDAALRQILAAIKHLGEEQYECAITPAGAAEGQLVAAEPNDFFQLIKTERPPDFPTEHAWVTWWNETRDWLKHPTPQLADDRFLSENEAWLMVFRAISKFQWAYKQSHPDFEAFIEWCVDRKYLPHGR